MRALETTAIMSATQLSLAEYNRQQQQRHHQQEMQQHSAFPVDANYIGAESENISLMRGDAASIDLDAINIAGVSLKQLILLAVVGMAV